jgi:UDP-glucuronate decarboxylase
VAFKMTQYLLSAIENTDVEYIIYSSSSETYGEPLKIPTNEEHPVLINTAFDRDSYAASKAIGEFYIRLFAKQHHLSYLTLRIFNMYGERMVGTRYGQVVPEFINRMLFEEQFTLLGDGKHTRSFCYILDATNMMRKLMEKKTTGLINVGNDEEISILELAKKIHQLNNTPFNPIFLPERTNDHKRRRPDISYLKSLLPELVFTDLKTGLKKVIDFYKIEA